MGRAPSPMREVGSLPRKAVAAVISSFVEKLFLSELRRDATVTGALSFSVAEYSTAPSVSMNRVISCPTKKLPETGSE